MFFENRINEENLLKDKFYCMVKRSFYRNFLKTLFNDKYRYIYILS